MSGVRCPKCGSNQIHSEKRGFKAGRAIAGTLIAGPLVGAASGAVGNNKIIITCLSCGHQFKPGQGGGSYAPSASTTQYTPATGSTGANVRKTFRCDHCGKITACFDRVPCPSCGNRMVEVEGVKTEQNNGNLSGGAVILIIALFVLVIIMIATCS